MVSLVLSREELENPVYEQVMLSTSRKEVQCQVALL
jgi:hypothetical protein